MPVRRLPRRPMFKVDATVEAPLPDVLGPIKPVPRFGASAAVSAEEVGSARRESGSNWQLSGWLMQSK